MRIAVAYHPKLVHVPMDAYELMTGPRGLTGSEVSCLMYALHLAERGHDTTWFGPIDGHINSHVLERLILRPYDDRAFASGWDAVLAWNSDEALRASSPSALRLLNMQLSEFGLCGPNWESTADLVCTLSSEQAKYMRGQTGCSTDKWRVMPNGVDLEAFRPARKVPGRMVWASSHDRGLHRVLSVWPSIKDAIPHATLSILYDTAGMHRHLNIIRPEWLWRELHHRAAYTIEACRRLESYGVRMLGAVGRADVQREFAQAEILPYPLEPVSFTETFGCTVLEAMASGCVPVITDADAFGELWASACPYVKAPLDELAYADLLLGVATDKAALTTWAGKGRAHAQAFAWEVLAERLERCLLTRGTDGFSNPWYSP